MMQPGEWTEEDLMMLTHEKVLLMQEFGLMTEHDAQRWYTLADQIDFILAEYMYFDAQYC